MSSKLTIEHINQMTAEVFCKTFGGIVEHAPWVAETVWTKQPFAGIHALHESICTLIMSKDEKVWAEILNAHPELSGKEAEHGTLTDFSKQEQTGLGLDRLKPEDAKRIREYNQTYRERFGFPFVICVKNLTKLDSLFAAQETRINHSRSEELSTGIQEVCEIARIRLEAMVVHSEVTV